MMYIIHVLLRMKKVFGVLKNRPVHSLTRHVVCYTEDIHCKLKYTCLVHMCESGLFRIWGTPTVCLPSFLVYWFICRNKIRWWHYLLDLCTAYIYKVTDIVLNTCTQCIINTVPQFTHHTHWPFTKMCFLWVEKGTPTNCTGQHVDNEINKMH